MSAAVLLKNIKPKRLKTGEWKIAESHFVSNIKLNCDGFVVRPEVKITIVCPLTKEQVRVARRQREEEKAKLGSPILK